MTNSLISTIQRQSQIANFWRLCKYVISSPNFCRHTSNQHATLHVIHKKKKLLITVRTSYSLKLNQFVYRTFYRYRDQFILRKTNQILYSAKNKTFWNLAKIYILPRFLFGLCWTASGIFLVIKKNEPHQYFHVILHLLIW